MKTRLMLALTCIFILASTPSVLQAGWIENGVPIAVAQYMQEYPAICPDGAGGAIIVWADYRTPQGGYLYGDIYVQRVDADGNVLWTTNGIAVCTDTLTQHYPEIVSDGAGGAIITWADYRDTYGNIYAQRVDANGNMLWTSGGILVCGASNMQCEPKIISDGAGGAIIVWKDWRVGSYSDIYAQRLNGSGTALWTTDGVAVCTAVNNQSDHRIATDGEKGVFVVWNDLRSGNYDIYVQRVDSSGTTKFLTDGYAVCNGTGVNVNPEIASDGFNCAIIVWRDDRNENYDIYAQRVDKNGSMFWTSQGIAVCTVAADQKYPMVVGIESEGAVVAWMDEQKGEYDHDIYAQKLDIYGNILWNPSGVAICTAGNEQILTDMASDDLGCTYLAWHDYRTSYHANIRLQKLDPSGTPLWGEGGLKVTDNVSEDMIPRMTTDGANGVIVTWERDVSGYSDVYAQRIDRYGYWGDAGPTIESISDVPNDQGGKVTVTWNASRLDNYANSIITHYSIWRSLSAQETAALLEEGTKSIKLSEVGIDFDGPAYRFMKVGTETYGWEWLANTTALFLDTYTYTAETLYDSTGTGTGYHHFFVAAHTEDPFCFWKSHADSGYSVDNLAPAEPKGLLAEQSFVPEGLEITWKPNTEEDLYNYRIYRGTTAEFIPGEENLIASTADTLYFDDEWRWDSDYYYKVTAVDIHGNEGPYSTLTPDDVTGEDTPTAAAVYYLAQNYPNPFNPVTAIEFGLEKAGHVRLEVFDVSGRLVRVLVDEWMETGRHSVPWDGCNALGQPASSGLYFYRIVAGDYREMKKMVLIR